MDLNSFRRRQSLSKTIDQRPEEQFEAPQRRFSLVGAMTMTKILAVSLLIFPVLLVIMILFGPDSYNQSNGFAEARVMVMKSEPNVTFPHDQRGDHAESLMDQRVGLDKGFDQKQNAGSLADGSVDMSQGNDKLLGGLLASGFQEDSCLSRYRTFLYRKDSVHKPSSYLLSRLRAYEELHGRCGPGSRPYAKAAAGLLKPRHTGGSELEGCAYVVLMSYSGLGNRVISIASAFLYTMLTDRILLVEGGEQVSDLFCEPFPETTWLLPEDFPLIGRFGSFDRNSADSYGEMLKKKLVDASSAPHRSHYLYLHLSHDYSDHDKMFFCQEDQSFLKNVPWLIMRTNNYFVPSLFLIPSFEQELGKLFPEKATVFHHLGRYLFHPTNHVWGLVTRYYRAYLAKADERIGLQIRVFDEKSGVSPHVTRQIISCVQTEELLPKLSKEESLTKLEEDSKHKAVLVTSLTTGYSEMLRSMYWENPTETGDVIGVYQPSHEGHQQTEKLIHNRKAWAEMYLLSLTDRLVISAWSTFGYVAQGLGGVEAWILVKPENQTTPEPPCVRAISADPCFHAPPYYNCQAKTGTDTGNVVPHVKHCEDISWGLKLVDTL